MSNSESVHSESNKLLRGVSVSDVVTYVLAIALLVTLALAASYGFRYGNVDESVATGNITIKVDNSTHAAISVDDNMRARVTYANKVMTGTLKLAGAEEDTILFQLRGIAFSDGSDASDAVLFIRMPRSGLQGDYSGAWMFYFSCPSQKVKKYSEWLIANEGGTGFWGFSDKLNAVTTLRKKLIKSASKATWVKEGIVLQFYRAN